MLKQIASGCLLVAGLMLAGVAQAQAGAELYRHGGERLGLAGPALLPGNLKRLRREDARRAIEQGLAATQMPAFGGQLDEQQIAALVEYIYAPPARTPSWGGDQIRASHRIDLIPKLLTCAPAQLHELVR